MPATPKLLRTPPPRIFENYILTKVSEPGVGLLRTNTQKMQPVQIPYLGAPYTLNGGQATSGTAITYDIGFDFKFNNTTYTKFVVLTAGWIVLLDPLNIPTTQFNFDITRVLSGLYSNEITKFKSTFTYNDVIISPWASNLAFLIAKNTEGYFNNDIITSEVYREKINTGLNSYPTSINAVEHGVHYYQGSNKNGRFLLVKWSLSLSAIAASSPTTTSPVVKFEAILYENGKIEFRYDTRKNLFNLQNVPDLSSTIGIFANGTGIANRFRDFSIELGYDAQRTPYKYGGSRYEENQSYTNNWRQSGGIPANYGVGLDPYKFWPGGHSYGALFTFEPPVNRRIILPKLTVAKNDSKNIVDSTVYNDIRALQFSDKIIVNYPTSLQRFIGNNTFGISERQNLYSGDFEVTGVLQRESLDQFFELISPKETKSISPYIEKNLFEVDNNELNFFNDGFTQNLRDKQQIKITLPINNTVRLLHTQSALLYYNNLNKGWRAPVNDINEISYLSNDTSRGSIHTFTREYKFGWNTAPVYEDSIGFGPLGNRIASGTLNPPDPFDNPTFGSDENIGLYTTNFLYEDIKKVIQKSYNKSIQIDNNFKASSAEVFIPQVQYPFLIEKVVISIPFAAGDGWFKDKTYASAPTQDSFLRTTDFGGPALTVALYNEFTLKNQNMKDLILTGTITHRLDMDNEIVMSAVKPNNSSYINVAGFAAYGGKPSCVITPLSSSEIGFFYTGSAEVRCRPQVSNGVFLSTKQFFTASIGSEPQRLTSFFNSKSIRLKSQDANTRNQIAYIDSFGRNSRGFRKCGRSFNKSDFFLKDISNNVINPFFLTGSEGKIVNYVNDIQGGNNNSGFPTQINRSIEIFANSGSGGNITAFTLIPMMSYENSPYLLMPGDVLSLSISKTRPHIWDFPAGISLPNYYLVSSSLTGRNPEPNVGHDVQMLTGSVEITLYGSYLREDKEVNIPNNVYNNNLYGIIGDEPILDQYDVEYDELLVSGSYGAIIRGRLLTKIEINNKTVLVSGPRGRVTNKWGTYRTNNITKESPGQTPYDTDNISAAYTRKPFLDYSGFQKILPLQDSSERYWDTLLPNISEIYKVDKTSLITTKASTFLGNLSNGVSPGIDQNLGFILNDEQHPVWAEQAQYNNTTNLEWSMAYPFEPRYLGLTRQQTTNKTISTDIEVIGDVYGKLPKSKLVRGLLYGMNGLKGASVPAPHADYKARSDNGFLWICDIDLRTNITGAASNEDLARAIYGFGDINNMMMAYVSGDPNPITLDEPYNTGPNGERVSRYGTNHAFDVKFRPKDANTYSHFGVSPIIRGWKYGVLNALPSYSTAYFRTQTYGQFRDMLEQRPFAKFFIENSETDVLNGVQISPVSVQFVDVDGKITNPENTWSQNLSNEATSSFPFLDGNFRNRNPIDVNKLNKTNVVFSSDTFGNLAI